jgi:hypothetical protein
MRVSGGSGGGGGGTASSSRDGNHHHQLSHVELQTLQVCAVLAMASDSHDCGQIFAASVAAMHPTLDEAACYTELARLATPAAGGKLIPLSRGGREGSGVGVGSHRTAVYSFSSRGEMESRYNELPADAARSLHYLAIEDYEARLQDGSAHDLAGLTYEQSQALGDDDDDGVDRGAVYITLTADQRILSADQGK